MSATVASTPSEVWEKAYVRAWAGIPLPAFPPSWPHRLRLRQMCGVEMVQRTIKADRIADKIAGYG